MRHNRLATAGRQGDAWKESFYRRIAMALGLIIDIQQAIDGIYPDTEASIARSNNT